MDLNAILQRLKLGHPDLNQTGRDFGPIYTQPGLVSIGGRIGPFGGTIGMDQGQPFGSANIQGRPFTLQNLLQYIQSQRR